MLQILRRTGGLRHAARRSGALGSYSSWSGTGRSTRNNTRPQAHAPSVLHLLARHPPHIVMVGSVRSMAQWTKNGKPLTTRDKLVLGGVGVLTVGAGIALGGIVLALAIPAAIAFGVWRFLKRGSLGQSDSLVEQWREQQRQQEEQLMRTGRGSSWVGAQIFNPLVEKVLENVARQGMAAMEAQHEKMLLIQEASMGAVMRHPACSAILGGNMEAEMPHAFAEHVVNDRSAIQMSFIVRGSKGWGTVSLKAEQKSVTDSPLSAADVGNLFTDLFIQFDNGRSYDLMDSLRSSGSSEIGGTPGTGRGGNVVDADFRDK